MLRAALAEMAARGLEVEAASALVRSRPIGPSQRDYANGAAVVWASLEPPALLCLLQDIEQDFGRRRQGQRWRARTLDLDLILWSGGCWADAELVIPHRAFRGRSFVLDPAVRIARDWRDPLTGLSLAHLRHRLGKRK
ncbi:MAG: 2-amino-4-hydroxy-6-hydroxymethyldihydropteridine diphosphokinase [Novosphingobium sp.]